MVQGSTEQPTVTLCMGGIYIYTEGCQGPRWPARLASCQHFALGSHCFVTRATEGLTHRHVDSCRNTKRTHRLTHHCCGSSVCSCRSSPTRHANNTHDMIGVEVAGDTHHIMKCSFHTSSVFLCGVWNEPCYRLKVRV